MKKDKYAAAPRPHGLQSKKLQVLRLCFTVIKVLLKLFEALNVLYDAIAKIWSHLNL
jgi:hypothetical protein